MAHTLPSIVVYCPLNPVAPKVQPATVQSILAMNWLGPLEIVLGREDMKKVPPRETVHENITRKYNTARQIVLDGGYDALLTIEADMIVPDITLRRMTMIDADVIYGLYVSRHGRRPWLAFDSLGGPPGQYSGASFSRLPELCAKAWGNVVESKGVGLGCTYIRREVLEAIEFRCAPDQQVANDWMFALDVDRGGFSQVHDCGIECGHIDGDNIYWPTADGGNRTERLSEWHI